MTRRTAVKRLLLGLALTSLLLLCGCTSGLVEERTEASRTLPETRASQGAPTADARTDEVVQVVLYLPDANGQKLTTSVVEVVVSAGQSLEEVTVRRLLARASEQFSSLNGQSLNLMNSPNAVEVSDNLVTVNLGVATRLLSNHQQFLLRVSITNTLTQLPGIQYVDVLINGRDEGVDLAATIPAGVLARYPSTGDLDAYWRQIEGQISQSGSGADLSKTIALYFVSADGKHLLPEVRNIVVSSNRDGSYVETILSELAKGSSIHLNTRQIVPTLNYLPDYDPPRILNPSGSAYQLIALTFYEGLDDYLAVMGGSRGMLFASLTYTLTSFIPGIDGLMIYIGNELVTQVEDLNGNLLTLDNGWMTRADFAGSVASNCHIYLPSKNGGSLIAVDRAVAQDQATQPRSLMRQLLIGPQSHDMGAETVTAFPEGVTEADILAIAVEGDTVLINLTQHFADACKSLDATQGRNMIYSIVNTLTELRGVNRVRFYVEGEQRQFLDSDLSTAGEFLRNTGLIQS